ncbi:MAG: leucine-rich repeat protein [Coriobacteriales bacterium]
MFCPNCGSPSDDVASFCAVCGSELPKAHGNVASQEPERITYAAANLAQEDSFVRASMGYQTFACPNCGMSTLVPDANGITAHCENCGSDIDIRTREVTVERHEHTHNYITYQNLDDHFELSHDNSVVRGLGAAARVDVSHVTIPGNHGITAIGDGFLYDSTQTESVELPAGLQRIGASAFCNCRKLAEVEIPATVSMIDSSAFENCESLTRIVIPDNARLGESVFRGCTGLREAIIGSNVVGGTGAFIACESLAHVVIGYGTNVAESMFANCPALTLVDFEGGSSTIGEYAFCDCTSLVDLRLPDGLTSIGGAAFRGCSVLHRLDVPASLSLIGTNAFENCASLGELDCSNVTRLGDGVFKGCKALVRVELNDGLPAIPPSMFENCARLMDIDIPSDCAMLGIRSFAGCASLASCILPAAIDAIPKDCFEDCACLTNVGEQAFNVGAGAFTACHNLRSIIVKGNVSPQAFEGCTSLERLAFAEGTTIIGLASFAHASALETLIVPLGVQRVDAFAFMGCTGLRRVVFAASVQVIDAGAFDGCAELESVVFAGKSAPSIGMDAFSGSSNLSELVGTMGLFMSAALGPLTRVMSGLCRVTMNDFDEIHVKDLCIELFGERTICVNGTDVQWKAWIEAHYPAPEGEPVNMDGTAELPERKRGLFRKLGK